MTKEDLYYICIRANNIKTKADICINKHKQSVSSLGFTEQFHKCLEDFNIPKDSSECYYMLKQIQNDQFYKKIKATKDKI